MKKLLREDELRKEYDIYRLRETANEGIGLEDLCKIAERFSKDILIEKWESCGYYKSFERWLKENKKIDTRAEITIAEILKDRDIEIDLCRDSVYQIFNIDNSTISLPFTGTGLSYTLQESNYEHSIDTYDVWEDGAYIKENITEEELNEYLQELYNEYN